MVNQMECQLITIRMDEFDNEYFKNNVLFDCAKKSSYKSWRHIDSFAFFRRLEIPIDAMREKVSFYRNLGFYYYLPNEFILAYLGLCRIFSMYRSVFSLLFVLSCVQNIETNICPIHPSTNTQL